MAHATRREFLATAAGITAAACRARASLGTEKDASGEGKAERPFWAGAAVTDITPDIGVTLNGLLMLDGPINEILDPLRVRCLVLDNGETRLAIVLCDSCVISQELIDKAKTLAHQRTGLAKQRMLVAPTHTHMAPRLASWFPLSELDQQYYDLVARRIAEAIDRAISNLAPASIGAGVSGRGDFLVNRRWIRKTLGTNPFGEQVDKVAMGSGPVKNRLLKPAGPIDPDLIVLSVQHADGKPLALLGNYAAHFGTIRRKVASADYFGRFSERVGQLLSAEDVDPPFVGIMSNGASADISGLRNATVEQATEALATEAVRICRSAGYQDRGVIAMRESDIELGVRKPSAQRLAWAKKILADPKAELSRARIFANEVLRMVDLPDRMTVKLQALRIGNVGIVAIPGEVFCETGLAIKKASPLKPTFVVSHANAWHGYLPTPEQHELGGMETWLRRASYLEVDATTKIEAEILSLLHEMVA